ncbi:MAG: 5,6-dimethylbenzimidazole synthase [Acidimicrobiaceae bacterium]|nr:5,6-dimethylbenzimidazole synthase [Acidimicrobiaceae bacterium]
MVLVINEGFYDLIYRRRDVRAQFNGGPVMPEVLFRVLSAANAAPSVGMSQPWDFILVEEVSLRTKFAEHVEQERVAFAGLLEGDRLSTFEKIKIEGILDSSMGIVVTYDAKRGAPAVLGRNTIDDAGLYSVCLAIENLWLAATNEGMGVGWVSFYKEEYLSQLMELPSHVRPIAWLCFGPVSHLEEIPDLERLGWQARRSLEHHVFSNKYGIEDSPNRWQLLG